MKKKFEYLERRGLPGGPNETFSYTTGVFSTEGYKRYSPDVNNPFNIIPSGNITMKDVDFPVEGTDNLGNSIMMRPGYDYKFPGNMVFERPIKEEKAVKPYGSINTFGNMAVAAGGLKSKNLDIEARYAKLLEQLGESKGSFNLGVNAKANKNNYQFNINPNITLSGDKPRIGINAGIKKTFRKGGGLLTQNMKCNNCGWSWRGVDGGKDATTCHKCGGSVLPKAQSGREQSRGETRRTAPTYMLPEVTVEAFPDATPAQRAALSTGPGNPMYRNAKSQLMNNKKPGNFANETKDAFGYLVAGAPMEGLQTLQSLLVEGIEAARGNDYNFKNAFPQYVTNAPNKQRLPSQTFLQNAPFPLQVAGDILIDPFAIAGAAKGGINAARYVKNFPKAFALNLDDVGAKVVKQGGFDGNFITRPLTPYGTNELTPGSHLYRKIGNKKGLQDLIEKGGAQAPAPMRMRSGITVDTPFFGVGKTPTESYSGIFAVETPLPSQSKYRWSSNVAGTKNYGVAPFDKQTGLPVKKIPLEDLEVYRKKWFSNNYKKLDKSNLEEGMKYADAQVALENMWKWGSRGYIAHEGLSHYSDSDNIKPWTPELVKFLTEENKIKIDPATGLQKREDGGALPKAQEGKQLPTYMLPEVEVKGYSNATPQQLEILRSPYASQGAKAAVRNELKSGIPFMESTKRAALMPFEFMGNMAAEASGVPSAYRIGKQIKKEGVGSVAKDVGLTLESVLLGTNPYSNIIPSPKEDYSGLGTTMDIATLLPYIGLAGRGVKQLGTAGLNNFSKSFVLNLDDVGTQAFKPLKANPSSSSVSKLGIKQEIPKPIKKQELNKFVKQEREKLFPDDLENAPKQTAQDTDYYGRPTTVETSYPKINPTKEYTNFKSKIKGTPDDDYLFRLSYADYMSSNKGSLIDPLPINVQIQGFTGNLEKFTRPSVHFSKNHIVSANSGNNWMDVPTIIMSKEDDILKTNSGFRKNKWSADSDTWIETMGDADALYYPKETTHIITGEPKMALQAKKLGYNVLYSDELNSLHKQIKKLQKKEPYLKADGSPEYNKLANEISELETKMNTYKQSIVNDLANTTTKTRIKGLDISSYPNHSLLSQAEKKPFLYTDATLDPKYARIEETPAFKNLRAKSNELVNQYKTLTEKGTVEEARAFFDAADGERIVSLASAPERIGLTKNSPEYLRAVSEFGKGINAPTKKVFRPAANSEQVQQLKNYYDIPEWHANFLLNQKNPKKLSYTGDKYRLGFYQDGGQLPKAQVGNGEYTVQAGNTFDGIANLKEVPKDLLRKANPDIDYNNIKVGQVINIPDAPKTKEERMEFSSSRKREDLTKNILSANKLENYLAESRGNTPEFWKATADTIAYHESGPWQRMDPKAIQRSQDKDTGEIFQGPGEGLFQIETDRAGGSNSFSTFKNRYANIAEALDMDADPEIMNAERPIDLPAEKQYTLFYSNLIESPDVKLKDYVDGKLSLEDLWLKGHKIKEAKGDRENFQESVQNARKKGIPFTQIGEETSDLEIYKNYINGLYDGTEMEAAAQRLYDKLNRVYYGKAKGLEMSVPNYIMTNIINRTN